MWQGPTLLNPHFATGAKDLDAARLFYEPLFRWDAQAQAVPMLAAQMPSRANGGLSEDGRSAIWTLKKGVQWHDGQPFTSDDVVFNWQYATDPATAGISSADYSGVKAIEKIDTHTVRMVFNGPTPDWTRCARVLLIPRHVFAPYTGSRSREAPANLQPVGTGPYKPVDFKPGDLLRAQLNPLYHQPAKPFFDSVELKGGGDPASAARAVLQTGEYDHAWNLQVEDELLVRMERNGKGRVELLETGNVEYLLLNMADPWSERDGERAHPASRHPVLSDAAVRQALGLLLDRQSAQQFIFGRTGRATANLINSPALYDSTGTRSEFSVAKAVAVLEAAGWKPGSDGVRQKAGRRLKLVFQTSTTPVRQKVQQLLKQSCAKAGIELELMSVTAAVFFSSDVGNPDTAAKFWADLQLLGTAARTPDPGGLLRFFLTREISSKANKWQGLNRARYSNPAFDALFDASETELDPQRRAELVVRMNDIVCKDNVVLPLMHRRNTHAVAHKLVAPMSGWDGVYSGIADWYRQA
jgi:peptide/nickel transport system substrate-binding protein